MAVDVSIVPCKSYDAEECRTALTQALAPFGGLDWVKEGMRVAIAEGIILSRHDPQEVLELARENLPFDFKPSILQSLEKHRRTEIDVINGAVVTYGKRHEIETPVNETLVAGIKGIERYIDITDPSH